MGNSNFNAKQKVEAQCKLDDLQKSIDLKKQFEALRPKPYTGLLYVFAGVLILLAASSLPAHGEEKNDLVFYLVFTGFIILGIVGSEVKRLHKRIETLAKMVSHE